MSPAREAYRRLAATHIGLLMPIRNGAQREEVREEIRGWLRTLRDLRGGAHVR